MDLLPKTYAEFRSREYWDSFFRKRKEKEFEWYGDFAHIKAPLTATLSTNDQILVIGCGNSNLSSNLYDAGYHEITNIDFSPIVINEMKKKNAKRLKMKWEVMDMLQTKYEDASFDLVLDKGALDALVSEDTESVRDDAQRMFKEIARVLRPGGRYVCVTLAQEHVLSKLLAFFGAIAWKLRIVRLAATPESPLCPFFVVATSVKEGGEQVEIVDEKHTRTLPISKVPEAVQEVQWMDSVKQRVKHISKGRMVSLELWDEKGGSTPRYSLTIVDNKAANIPQTQSKCAVFVVPIGREHEWLFSNEEGQFQLAESAGFQRLIIVALNRTHKYEGGLQRIQDELSPKVIDLLPLNSRREKTPFVSAGDDLGERTNVCERTSELSGRMVVDDVKSGKNTFRRLVFLSNPRVIQSEVRLLPPNKNTNNNNNNIDYHYLTSEYHQLMVAGLSLLSPHIPTPSTSSTPSTPSSTTPTPPLRLLLIGLGGGVFPMFLHQHFPWLNVEVVELDPAVAGVAQECFGFREDSRMRLHIAEGVRFVRDRLAEARGAKPQDTKPKEGEQQNKDGEEQNKKEGETQNATKDSNTNNNNNNTTNNIDPAQCYNVIIVDVDSKDVTVGMSCPPATFLEPPFLDAVQALLHPTSSLLMFNLACRSQALLASTLESLGKRFAQVCVAQAEEDVNKVAVCLPRKVEGESKKVVEQGVGAILGSAHSWDKDVFDLKEMAELIHDVAQEAQPKEATQQQEKTQQNKPHKKKGGKKGGKKKGKK
eukprot:Phypoly_transcript_03153.p1 GENE.Phypoly_transcript_03153~~Phypoly_transcript_03153.p1  ORF type:complete len:779 (+),score=240.35 Phypoly_transcript_03153:50-2338(+)